MTLIGSSFGGLTCAWLGQHYKCVRSLILLAPAFGFPSIWLASLGEETIRQWQTSGYLPVYHYGQKRSLPLHYQFIVDSEQYPEHGLQKPIPTLILHGRNDEVISIQNSRDYAAKRPWVELIELDSDHSLTNVMPQMWTEIKDFLGI